MSYKEKYKNKILQLVQDMKNERLLLDQKIGSIEEALYQNDEWNIDALLSLEVISDKEYSNLDREFNSETEKK